MQAIGHVGTLDPAAEGVLVILLGRATRVQDLLLDLPKTYFFEVKLGFATDTLDLEGEKVAEAPVPEITISQAAEAAKQFVGPISQRAPVYSAIKIAGQPAYARARKGQDLTDASALLRNVTVHALDVVGYENQTLSLRVTCSKGTYVRAIGRDLAESLGTVGTVTRLIREQAAGFDKANCVEMDALLQNERPLDSYLTPLADISLPAFKTDDNVVADRLKNGQTISIPSLERLSQPCSDEPVVVLKDHLGEVFGLAKVWKENDRFLLRMKRGLL